MNKDYGWKWAMSDRLNESAGKANVTVDKRDRFGLAV
jgi:hypothetical protein